MDWQTGGTLWPGQHRGHPHGHSGTPDKVEWRIRHERTIQVTQPNPTRRDILDFHITSSHDRNCFGPLADRHVDLEEMFWQTKFHGGNASGTFGTPYANSQSTTETQRNTGDQQSGHQIKCVYPHSYQHLMKKLPEERERYWNKIRSDINDKF